MRGASGLGVKKLAKPPAYVNTLKKLEQQREQLLREAEACTQLSALTLQREQVLLDLLAVQEALMQHIAASSCSDESTHEPGTEGFGRSGSSSAPAGSQGQQQHQQQGQQQHQQRPLQPQLQHILQHAQTQQGQKQQHMWQQQQGQQQGQGQHMWQQQQGQQQQQEGQQPRQAHQLLECSYMAHLLASVTAKQVARVMSMTTADWSAFFNDSFTQLVVLLELCEREEPPAAQQLMLLHTQQQVPTAAAGAAAGAVRAAAPPPAAAQSPTGVCFASTLARLHALVDEWVVLSAVALIHNPVPLYIATTLNHATRTPASPPPGPPYWARLVKRLGLTRQQALHFAVAMEEIGRLDRATLQHNGALARTAACPSLLVAASSAAAATLAGAAAADGGVGDAAEQQQQDAAGGSRSGRARAPPAAARSHRTIASPQPSSAGSSGSAPAAAAAAASYDDGSGDGSDGSDGDGSSSAPVRAEILLQRKVQRIPLQGVLLLSFNVNTLSRLQVAKVIVASYPFLPMTMAIGAAAAKLFDASMLSISDERSLLLGPAIPCQDQPLLRVEQEQLWQRCRLLQRQQHGWWREHAGAWA